MVIELQTAKKHADNPGRMPKIGIQSPPNLGSCRQIRDFFTAKGWVQNSRIGSSCLPVKAALKRANPVSALRCWCGDGHIAGAGEDTGSTVGRRAQLGAPPVVRDLARG